MLRRALLRERYMRRYIVASLVATIAMAASAAQPQTDGLAELRWLVGEWRGVGQGDPGRSGSERHIDSILEGKYLRAHGRSVYPKQEKNPKGEIHEELDLWSYDRARSAIILRQFDTLGFVGTYVLDKAAS